MAPFAEEADVETVASAAVVAEVGAEHMVATAQTTAFAASLAPQVSAGAASEVVETSCPEQAQGWRLVKRLDCLDQQLLLLEVEETACGNLAVDLGKLVSSAATHA